MSRTYFDLAHAFTAQWEGGYVNHPDDPGGPTNFGVSLRWLRAEGLDLNDDGVVDEKDVLALTPQSSADLYYRHFWLSPDLTRLPAPVAIVTYDGCVNLGVARAVRHLQQCCNSLSDPAVIFLPVTGYLGRETVARVAALCAGDPGADALCKRLLDIRAQYYDELVARRPKMQAFYSGWIRRVNALRGYVKALPEVQP